MKLFKKDKNISSKSNNKEDTDKENNVIAEKFKVCAIMINDFPFELMLNMSLLDENIRKDFTWLWTITLQTFDNDEQGLPLNEESGKLIKLMQDAIHKILQGAEIQIVGTTTHRGVYDIMFYAKEEDSAYIGGTIAEMPGHLEDRKGRFAKYTGKRDSDWELVRDYYEVCKAQNN